MIKVIEQEFSVCKLADNGDRTEDAPQKRFDGQKFAEGLLASGEICFIGNTDEELSLVCPTESAPASGWEREDGFRAFRLQGVLDFSLIGILADISSVLAAEKIGIFAVSTYNTDYILTKEENFNKALERLSAAGYLILE